MVVYKDSSVDENEFDFQNNLPYFKILVAYTISKYETLTDDLSNRIQYLPEDKIIKYTKFMLSIVAYLTCKNILYLLLQKRIEHKNVKYLLIKGSRTRYYLCLFRKL